MKIVAVKKDARGIIEQYKLETGKIIGVEEAVKLAESHQLDNCNAFTTRNGSQAIRSNNDGDPSNNLDNLPTF